MGSLQDRYDDAMFDFTRGDCEAAITKLRAILEEDPAFFDAQLSLGGAYYAKGDFNAAIEEGKKAEQLKPHDQLVHTSLSRAYMKSGDKKTAEHHQLQSRIASWKENMTAPGSTAPVGGEGELQMAKPAMPPVPVPQKFPDMPWKKKALPVEPPSSKTPG